MPRRKTKGRSREERKESANIRTDKKPKKSK